MPIKPRRLNYGDTIGIVAPASAPPGPNSIDAAIETMRRLGFRSKLASNARKRRGFLAGSDRERAADLMNMFADAAVKAILCVRGGYGSARILPLLDYRAIRANPKIFIGYSDITSLHCALFTQANLVSFHGPMLHSDLLKKDLPHFTLQSFLKTLMQPLAPGSICENYSDGQVSIVRRGRAVGPLLGGNLSLLCTTLGTPYQPSLKKKILFLEEIEEAPYRIDRMLTHLLNARLLQDVAGVAIGINRNCQPRPSKNPGNDSPTAEKVLEERLRPLGVPVVTGLPFDHVPFNATLPVGVRAELDAYKGDLVIIEAAVT